MTRNRRADWRRIKSLLSYTVDEAARTLGVHRGTVRHCYLVRTRVSLKPRLILERQAALSSWDLRRPH
jgi:hypothetical protein